MLKLKAYSTISLMEVHLLNARVGELEDGDLILRESIGGFHFVEVTDVYRVYAGSAEGRLAVHYRYEWPNGEDRHGYFHAADTDLVQRAIEL